MVTEKKNSKNRTKNRQKVNSEPKIAETVENVSNLKHCSRFVLFFSFHSVFFFSIRFVLFFRFVFGGRALGIGFNIQNVYHLLTNDSSE